jgi:hypothetical protein
MKLSQRPVVIAAAYHHTSLPWIIKGMSVTVAVRW